MKHLYISILILLSCIASFITGCDWGRMKYLTADQPNEIVYQTVVKHDSVETIIRLPGNTIKIIDSVFVATSNKVDTAAILNRFNYSYLLADTFRNNELQIITEDSIFQNRITSRQIAYKILRADSIVTKEITINPNRLYAGLGFIITPEISGFNPKILFAHKQGFAFDAGMIIGPSRPGFSGSIYFKIK